MLRQIRIVDLEQLNLHHLPNYLLSWKVYGAAAICLVLEAVFFVRLRPLFSVELAQDFVFGFVRRALLVPLWFATAAVYMAAYELVLPAGEWQIARAWPVWAQFVVGFVAADFAVYLAHWMLHKIPVLWQFHAVHHSQTNLNPFTTHRTHPVQNIVEDTVRYLPLAVLGVGYPTWVGVRAFNWVWAHVIHSNVRWTLGPLGHVLVSPQYHRLHHSKDPEHHDRNLAGRLVVWDRLFGTYHPDREAYPETGIPDASYPVETSARPVALVRQLARQYAYPFQAIWRERATTTPLARAP